MTSKKYAVTRSKGKGTVAKGMDGETMRGLIESAGIGQTEIAVILEVGARHVRKLIADEALITKRAAYAIRWLHYCRIKGVNPDTGKPEKD